MIEVKKFVLHIVKTKFDTKINQEIIDKHKEIRITPANKENIMRMKEDIAEKLKREKERGIWTYWYVVLQIDGPANKPLFRTVVGKTLF